MRKLLVFILLAVMCHFVGNAQIEESSPPNDREMLDIRLRMLFPSQKSYQIDAMIAGRSEINRGLIGFFQLGIIQPINQKEDGKTSLGINYRNTQEIDFFAHRLFGFISFDNIELDDHFGFNFRFGMQGSLIEGSGSIVPFVRSRVEVFGDNLLNSKQFSPIGSFEYFVNPLVSFENINPPQSVYRFIMGNKFKIGDNVTVTPSIWSQIRSYENKPDLRSKDQVYALLFVYEL